MASNESYVVPGVADKNAYSITYAPNNNRDEPHLITLKPDWGDGDSKRWPQEDKDMRKLPKDDQKATLWRRTAAEWIAKDLGLFDPVDGVHWELEEMPRGYALFQQVTQPKADNPNPKLRLDRFVFGHSGRKIRSAISLGKHLIWVLHGSPGQCVCDGCKAAPKAPGRGSPKPRKPRRVNVASDSDDSDGTPRKRRGRPAGPTGRRGVKSKRGRKALDSAGRLAYQTGLRAFSSDSETEDDQSEPAPRPPRPPKVRLPAIPADLDCFEKLTLRADEPGALANAAASQLRLENTLHPALPRQGELVWARVQGLDHIGKEDVAIPYWPAVVLYREPATSLNGRKAAWDVELLTTGALVNLHRATEGDVLPWLGYTPKVVKGKVGTSGDGRPWAGLSTAELWQRGADAVFGCFELAVQTGKVMASMQMRPLPTLHAWPRMSRFLAHPYIHFGPEIIYPGDLLRLLPAFENTLPAGITPRKPPKLPTTLAIRVTRFARPAVEADSGSTPPLVIVGRVFEMYELRDTADALLGPSKDDDDGADIPTSDSGWDSTGSSAYSDFNQPPAHSRTSTRRLPAAFSSHRWRCLTATEDVAIPFASIAGRYYPTTTDIDATGVNNIAEKVRRTGLIGEGGIKPLSLGLSGLVSVGRVPVILAVNGIREGVERAQVASEVAAKMLFPEGKVPAELLAPPIAPEPVSLPAIPALPSSVTNAASATPAPQPTLPSAALPAFPSSLLSRPTASTPARFLPSSYPDGGARSSSSSATSALAAVAAASSTASASASPVRQGTPHGSSRTPKMEDVLERRQPAADRMDMSDDWSGDLAGYGTEPATAEEGKLEWD